MSEKKAVSKKVAPKARVAVQARKKETAAWPEPEEAAPPQPKPVEVAESQQPKPAPAPPEVAQSFAM